MLYCEIKKSGEFNFLKIKKIVEFNVNLLLLVFVTNIIKTLISITLKNMF